MKNSDNKRLLVIRNRGQFGKYEFTALCPRDLSEIRDESFELPFLYPRSVIHFNSCRDLICIYELEGHIYVLNPTTKQCLLFPTEEVSQFDEKQTLLLGACIGYDSKCDDYKILRVCERVIMAPSYRTLNTYQLYSFKEDSWNQIDRVANPDDTSKSSFQAAFVRGKCYWCVALDRIESWDCSEKTLSYIDFPPERRITRYGQLVQINGGDSLGFVGFSDRDPKVGHDYEVWVWSEELKRWDRQFSVSLGGAVGRPVGTIFGTFLFLHGMAGTPDEYIRRLVAYDWSKDDCKESCKELGIRNYRFRINVLCYVEGTVVLPCGKHGKAISGSSIINNPPIVTVGPPEKYCICGCHHGTKNPFRCKCCKLYSDVYKLDLEDFAYNGFRVLRDISKKQLALTGNPDAEGGKKKKKKKKTPDAQGNISRHHLYKREGGSNICSDEGDPMEALLKSDEVSEAFKQEIHKMAKLIKDLKKENTFMKSKCDKSDITIIQLANEHEILKKQLEQMRNQKDKLESLCRSLQAERMTNSAASNGSYSIPD
ncbi:uncharacterized protein LOC131014838 isoform X2 [Salvia miltiorrhiza]|uniref:uncharacterized protein LOC131014838 isoform X2 n=1 Tax=Salvia miltiorrhiza TaxID=226208 RepID=UPI0025AD2ADB|nr:uncharacterized protein LOC131014838 isoform X2 [Salvia miltiorrhiza]